MGRKAKCTVEEKRKAVEDYINGLRSVAEIMSDYSIKSSRSVRNWLAAYQHHGEIALHPSSRNSNYSSDFKAMVVEKHMNGEASVTDLCALYEIKAHKTLQDWILLYRA